MFQKYVSSVSSGFICMLQPLHLNVSKVDQLLHVLQYYPPVAVSRGGARDRVGRRCCEGLGWAKTPCRASARAKRRRGRLEVRVGLNVRTCVKRLIEC